MFLCVCVCVTHLSLFWISAAVVCVFPSDHIPVFSTACQLQSRWKWFLVWAEIWGSDQACVCVHACMFWPNTQMSCGISVRRAYNCVRSGLSVCVSVCLCLGLHMEIFTQMSWHNCGKSVCRSESTEPLTGTPTSSEGNRRGEAVLCYPPPFRKSWDREWEDSWKPLFSPLLVAGKALSTPSRTKQPCSDPSIGLFHSFWLRRSFHTTGDQGIRLGCGLDWKYTLENTHWPLDHISPHPFADYKSLCGQGMPSTLLMAAKMWLPQGPEQNKYHSSPAQFKQARRMSVKVHSCSQWGWMHSVYIWKGDV